MPTDMRYADMDDYIERALVTEKPVPELNGDPAFVHLAIETLVEAGKLADLLKKQLVYGRAIPDLMFKDQLREISEMAQAAHDTISTNVLVVRPLELQPRLLHAALGGYGEQGELLEALIEGTDELDLLNIKEEAGDTMWYAALLLDELHKLGVATPVEVLEANIRKLTLRAKSNGVANAANRDLPAERAALEG